MPALAVSGGVESRAQVLGSSSAPSAVNQDLATARDSATGGISPHVNAAAVRRSFPAAWAEYLRANYRTAYAVQRAFGIDSKTARDWIGGKRDPSGSFVAAAIAADPSAIHILGRSA